MACEATRIIEQLSQAEVDDVVPAGDSFRVFTRVLGGIATHVLKTPSARDVIEYRRGFLRSVDLPYGRREITVLVRAGAVPGRAGERRPLRHVPAEPAW